MEESLTMNDGMVLERSSAILSWNLFVYLREVGFREAIEMLTDPEKTARIVYTRNSGEQAVFEGYTRLTAITDEGNGLVTAVLRKDVNG